MPSNGPGTGTRLWTPLDSGWPIVGWWDPSDSSKVLQSSGSVDALVASNPSGATLTNTLTNRPTLSTINGVTCLSLASASSQGLKNTAIPAERGTTGTWFAVVTAATFSAFRRILSLASAAGNDFDNTSSIVALLNEFSVAPAEWGSYYNNAERAKVSGQATNTSYILTTQRDGDTSRAWVNGASINTTTGLGTSAFNITRVFLGTDNGGSSGWDGKIGDVLWIRPALPIAELHTAWRFFSAKYRIPLATGGTCSPPLAFA